MPTETLLDPAIHRLLEAAPRRAPMWEQPIAEVRARVAAGNALCAPGPPLRSVETRGFPARGGENIPTLVYSSGTPHATIVYAHGGGWVTGDLAYSDELCRQLAVACRATVVSVGYRLAPEHPFPAPLDDVEDVVESVGADDHFPQPLVLAGDSAGGNLAAAVCLRQRAVGTVDGQILLYPVLDHDFERPSYHEAWRGVLLSRESIAWFWDSYLPDSPTRSRHEASPLRDAQPERTPPSLVVTAGFDPLRDEGAAYVRRLRDAGAEVTHLDEPSLPHGFCRLTGVSPAAAAASHRVSRAAAVLVARLVGR